MADVQALGAGPLFALSARKVASIPLKRRSRWIERDIPAAITAHVMGHVLHIADVERNLTVLFRDERANDRAVNFKSSFVTLGNVLGKEPRTSAGDWADSERAAYPLKRDRKWDTSLPSATHTGEGEANGQNDWRTATHDQIRAVSPIRRELWDAAKWSGTAFMWLVEHEAPPVMALIFQDRESAARILSRWKSEMGERDEDDRIRIAIILSASPSKKASGWLSPWRAVACLRPGAIGNHEYFSAARFLRSIGVDADARFLLAPGEHQQAAVDVVSYGPDRLPNTTDDIKSWEP